MKLQRVRLLVVTAAAFAASMAFVRPASGAMLTASGLVHPSATADVSFTYQSLSDSAAQITVGITNTTSSLFGGHITAWGFNVPTIAGVTITSIGGDIDDAGAQQATAIPSTSGWWGRFDYDKIKSPNDAGFFDYGVMNSNTVNAFITDGTGSGIQITEGSSLTFVLDLVGSGLDNLSNAQFETAFLNEMSVDGAAGGFNFALRFQSVGPDGDWSDLATSTTVVPVPGAVMLAAVGLLGVGFLRRRGS